MADLSHRFGHRYIRPDSGIELRAFTHGLMPDSVPEMMQRFTDDWKNLGVDAWNETPNHWLPDSGESVGWWNLPEYLGDQFIAPLLSAEKQTCIMQPNAHWSFNCVLSSEGLFDSKDTVLVSEGSFPSVYHSIQRWANVFGYTVKVVPLLNDGQIDTETMISYIDSSTALVAVSHVGFTTGALLPTSASLQVADAIHNAGGLYVVDGYHAAGSVPVDVQRMGCDIYIGGLLKESSGSSGNGFVYIRPGLNLYPRLSGWFGDADPFGFQDVPHPHPEVRRRFLGGTTAVASLYHAVEGVKILLDAGLNAVRDDSMMKVEYCIERAEYLRLPIRSQREIEKRSSMFIVEIENASQFSEHLKSRGIYGDSRLNRYFRIAPFVWNSMDELEMVWDEIEKLWLQAGIPQMPIPERTGPVT